MRACLLCLSACLFACSTAAADKPAPARPAPRSAHPSPLGINLAPLVDWGTERPFVDLMKQSRAWISSNGMSWDDGRSIPVDKRGWPTHLEPGQIARTLLVWDVDAPPGAYVVTWKGRGAIDLAPQKATTMAEHRATFTLGTVRGIAVTILATDPMDPIRDIRVVPAAFEDKPDVFQPQFLDSLKSFSVLRFMDWMQVNASVSKSGASRPVPEAARYTGDDGVPAEVMVQLCNTLGADPWFSIPHTWDDDAVRAFATVVRDRLKPELKVWVEHSNEVWNDAFPQARYAHGRGGALAQDAFQGRLRFHSQRTVAIVKIFREVFGAQATRVVGVMASQAANPWVGEQLLEWKGAAASVDALAIAPYFGGSLGEQDQRERVRAMSSADIHAALGAAVETSLGWVRDQKKLADRFGVALVAYEGGQHLVGVGGAVNDDQLTQRFLTTNAEPQMKAHYLRFLAGWRETGGTLFAHYASTQPSNKFGSWGAREAPEQPRANAPKWDALLTFIESTPRWW